MPGEVEGRGQDTARLEILLKEAEFLRAEALLCIGRVRYLGVFSIAVGGAAVPVLATLLTQGGGGSVSMSDRLRRELFAVQVMMFGVTLASAGLLQIYTGVFKQIFAFAAYFRQALVPDINATLARLDPSVTRAPVMGWELWLQQERARSRLNVGDSDLKAEPILIALICVTYAGAAVATSYYTQTQMWLSVSLMAFTVVFLIRKFTGFSKILKASTQD